MDGKNPCASQLNNALKDGMGLIDTTTCAFFICPVFIYEILSS
jgi:hypothetical protein